MVKLTFQKRADWAEWFTQKPTWAKFSSLEQKIYDLREEEEGCLPSQIHQGWSRPTHGEGRGD
jgi:hypothetical protein